MTPSPPLLRRITPRTVDEIECVLSVLLAIAIAHWLNATHVSWAAYAGYMVMRGHIAETLSRGLTRIVGTVAGGLSALLLAPYLIDSIPLATSALLLVGTGTLYGALTAKRAYGWLFLGLTFAMVVLDKMERPDITLASFVGTRIAETVAGTLACVIISLLSALTLRRIWPAPATSPAPAISWHPGALRYALQGGIALVLLVLVGTRFDLPALAQSAVTIMAVLLVPAAGLDAAAVTPVRERMRLRFLGCIAGAAVSGAVLLLAAGSAPVLIFGTVAGIALGRHVENGTSRYRYAGVQFSLAILVILVPDSYAGATIEPGYERLFGILIGMALLEPILILSHWLIPHRTRESSVRPGASGSSDL